MIDFPAKSSQTWGVSTTQIDIKGYVEKKVNGEIIMHLPNSGITPVLQVIGA